MDTEDIYQASGMIIDFRLLPPVAQKKIKDIASIDLIAQNMGYRLVNIDYDKGMFAYGHPLNKVWATIYTVPFAITTALNHPKRGKSQLHRNDVTVTEIIEVLTNPRVHTGKGSFKKKE